MPRLSLAALTLTAAALTAATLPQPARADLVIDGRAAQALHCAAMLFMVSDTLYDAGLLDSTTTNTAQENAVRMLAFVPGTDDQKVQAMGQRFAKLQRSRTLDQLFDEYNSTATWCTKTFL